MRHASIPRILVAVLLGYATMVILSTGTTALLRALVDAARAQPVPDWYEAFDLGYSIAYMAAGGAVAGWVGRSIGSVVALAVALLILGIVVVIGSLDSGHSLAYQLTTAIVGPLTILLAGRFTVSRAYSASRPADS